MRGLFTKQWVGLKDTDKDGEGPPRLVRVGCYFHTCAEGLKVPVLDTGESHSEGRCHLTGAVALWRGIQPPAKP